MNDNSLHTMMAQAVQRRRAREHRLSFYTGFVIGGLALLFATKVFAASAELPVKARIIQCGTRYEALGQCKAGVEDCCAFAPIENAEELNEITPAAGYPDIDLHGTEATAEETDEGFTVNFE